MEQRIRTAREIGVALRSESEQRMHDLSSWRLRRWTEALGDGLAPLLESPAEALRHATQGTGMERRIAIEVLSTHWKSGRDASYVALLADVITNDKDDEPREAAILAVGLAFRREFNAKWLAALAQLVINDGESYRIRRAAYAAISGIAGKALPYFPSRAKTGTGLWQFPDDVDWEFVESCLTHNVVAEDLLRPVNSVRPSPWEQECLTAAGEGLAYQLINQDVTFEECNEFLTRSANWAVYSLRARLHFCTGNWQEAIDDANHAIAINPAAFEPLRTRASAHLMLGNCKRAKADFNRYRKTLKNAVARK